MHPLTKELIVSGLFSVTLILLAIRTLVTLNKNIRFIIKKIVKDYGIIIKNRLKFKEVLALIKLSLKEHSVLTSGKSSNFNDSFSYKNYGLLIIESLILIVGTVVMVVLSNDAIFDQVIFFKLKNLDAFIPITVLLIGDLIFVCRNTFKKIDKDGIFYKSDDRDTTRELTLLFIMYCIVYAITYILV